MGAKSSIYFKIMSNEALRDEGRDLPKVTQVQRGCCNYPLSSEKNSNPLCQMLNFFEAFNL